MKRYALLLASIIVCAVSFTSCNNKSEEPKEEEKYYLTNPKKIYQPWFDEFQKKHPKWLDVDEVSGMDSLRADFQNEMINNADFRRAMMNNQSGANFPSSMLIESMGKYEDTAKNEKGEIKIFLLRAEANLIEPMYDGSKKIDLIYEITSAIPSTSTERSKPYLENADTCILAKKIYFNNRNCSSKILGSFIIK